MTHQMEGSLGELDITSFGKPAFYVYFTVCLRSYDLRVSRMSILPPMAVTVSTLSRSIPPSSSIICSVL